MDDLKKKKRKSPIHFLLKNLQNPKTTKLICYCRFTLSLSHFLSPWKQKLVGDSTIVWTLPQTVSNSINSFYFFTIFLPPPRYCVSRFQPIRSLSYLLQICSDVCVSVIINSISTFISIPVFILISLLCLGFQSQCENS